LLEPNESWFRFIEPLGIAREVKVAASGLFGRFVARAYLERHFGLTLFGHIGTKVITLDGQKVIEVRRKPGKRGDLPDWIACSNDLRKLTVAEAKGSHEKPGPEKTLKRAWEQAGRVHIVADGRRMTVKRIAIVTRWASKIGGSTTPIISVRDPQEMGDPVTADKEDPACVGIARLHVASLLAPLGYTDLATSLRRLLDRESRRERHDPPLIVARRAFDRVRPRTIRGETAFPQSEELVGSFVTRAGPLPSDDISNDTARNLRSLQLRPMFVGIERNVVAAVIDGDAQRIRQRMQRERPHYGDEVTTDSGGIWVVRIGGLNSVA
jgi:hypothetical protein